MVWRPEPLLKNVAFEYYFFQFYGSDRQSAPTLIRNGFP